MSRRSSDRSPDGSRPPARSDPRDPWHHAPVSELQDQVLPRWFVLLCLALILAAVATVIAAFAVFGPDEVGIAQRRPPPAGALTNDVGRYVVGSAPPQPYAQTCQTLRGIQIAGTPLDRAALRRGLAGLCNTSLPAEARQRLSAFATAGGVVRFAQFEATGVDSTALLTADPPAILINARLTRTDPLWIAPLVAHDTTFFQGTDPASAEAALAARRVEDLVCDRLLAGRRESRGCADAEALLAMPDPLAALRGAGYR
ncbi:MAG: hypothetical protein M3493_06310 [Actinomycetota bacterium]|nr:hypothetical protein [Actinomycetota bacterium]